jgi:hypothetical protein
MPTAVRSLRVALAAPLAAGALGGARAPDAAAVLREKEQLAMPERNEPRHRRKNAAGMGPAASKK